MLLCKSSLTPSGIGGRDNGIVTVAIIFCTAAPVACSLSLLVCVACFCFLSPLTERLRSGATPGTPRGSTAGDVSWPLVGVMSHID